MFHELRFTIKRSFVWKNISFSSCWSSLHFFPVKKPLPSHHLPLPLFRQVSMKPLIAPIRMNRSVGQIRSPIVMLAMQPWIRQQSPMKGFVAYQRHQPHSRLVPAARIKVNVSHSTNQSAEKMGKPTATHVMPNKLVSLSCMKGNVSKMKHVRLLNLILKNAPPTSAELRGIFFI